MPRPRGPAPPYSPRRVYLLPGETLYDGCAVKPKNDCHQRQYIPIAQIEDETVLLQLERHLGRQLEFGDPHLTPRLNLASPL